MALLNQSVVLATQRKSPEVAFGTSCFQWSVSKAGERVAHVGVEQDQLADKHVFNQPKPQERVDESHAQA
jgi:hypothetical protein